MFVDWFWIVVMYLSTLEDNGAVSNDWLTRLPLMWQPVVRGLGEWLISVPAASQTYVWTAIHFVLALWNISQ